jgi:hypothetical protein
VDRRTFLQRVGALGASLGLGGLAAACGSAPAAPAARSGAKPHGSTGVQLVDGLPVADWVVEENKSPDRTYAWTIPRQNSGTLPAPIEGYLDVVSAERGDEITLFVNTVAPTFTASIFRMGFYGGFGAKRVLTSPALAGVRQKAPTRESGTNLVECDWTPSWRVTIGEKWAPGAYLIKLVGSRDQQQYVPFTVRDDTSHASYVVQSAVTTWQAYNPYGGFSLYGGTLPGQSNYGARSRIVSFDRPYSHDATALDARGSGDFLGNELPFIYLAERHGLDLTYWTDLDLHARPQLLANHACLVTLGHDEYWSGVMRTAVEERIEKGLNVVFFGANACYRQIRLADSPLGENRRVICYKDSAEDPLLKSDPALVTGDSWATDPIPRPESDLVGVMYRAYGGSGPLVVVDPAHWVFAGTGLKEHDTIPTLIGSEFDAFVPSYPHPDNVEILAHSPTPSVAGPGYSDMSYYALPHKGAVFATGTASFVTALWDGMGRLPHRLGFGVQTDRFRPVTRIALNVLAAFGSGPAGSKYPSQQTWQRFYAQNVKAKPSVDVP